MTGSFLVNVVIVTAVTVVTLTIIGVVFFGVKLDGGKIESLVGALGLGTICFMARGVAFLLVVRSGEADVPIVNVACFLLAFVSGVFFDAPLTALEQVAHGDAPSRSHRVMCPS